MDTMAQASPGPGSDVGVGLGEEPRNRAVLFLFSAGFIVVPWAGFMLLAYAIQRELPYVFLYTPPSDAGRAELEAFTRACNAVGTLVYRICWDAVLCTYAVFCIPVTLFSFKFWRRYC